MEKIIFLGLSIPILGIVFYLGATAIMSGFNAKEANRAKNDTEDGQALSSDINNISDEFSKLDNLRESGVITKEEFEKAKKKILDN